jgi:hypothetical protein
MESLERQYKKKIKREIITSHRKMLKQDRRLQILSILVLSPIIVGLIGGIVAGSIIISIACLISSLFWVRLIWFT